MWPTPLATDWRGSKTFGNGVMKLPGFVAKFPTPTASDATSGGRHGNGSLKLQGAVALFPTPKARDGKDTGTVPPSRQQDPGKDTLGQRVARDGDGGPLNPTWVEWLMGFPNGWTDLEE